MNTGSSESSRNDMLRMPPRHMLQQVVGMDSMNQWHAEIVKRDSSLRGIVNMNSQGKKGSWTGKLCAVKGD